MYLPPAFAESSRPRLHEFVRVHGFATLVSCAPTLFASHLPLLLDAGRGAHGVLRGHLARANPHWRHFHPDQEVLAIFQGPHAFVSSNWYEQPAEMVPTWNFTAVHVYGTPRLLEDPDAVFALLRDLVRQYQPDGHPLPLEPPSERAQALARAIVAFEIDVTRWEGKFKLSQNRSAEDRRRVQAALRERGSSDDQAVADLMDALEP